MNQDQQIFKIENGVLLGVTRYGSTFKELVIPDNVVEIKEKAFHMRKRLKSVTIPSSVKTIGTGAFAWCIGLENVIIGDVETIMDHAFYMCWSLNNLKLSSGIKQIGDFAFKRCEKLNKFDIPRNATVGCFAFDWLKV